MSRSIRQHSHRHRTVAAVAAVVVASSLVASSASAVAITWSGTASTDFEAGGNWSGGVAPANNATADTGLFTGTPTANQPQLTTSRSVLGVQFGSGGWNLGSSSPSNVLTLGTSGILGTATTGTNVVSANLGLVSNASMTNVFLGAGTSAVGISQITLTGSITAGTSASPIQTSVIVGSTSRKDTVLINPSAGNSVNLYLTSVGAAGGVLGGGGGGTLVLGDVGANATTSVNTISNTLGTGGQPASLRYQSGGTLQINSGTWITNDVGGGNSNTATGIFNITGGTLKTGAARYIVNGGGTATMTGGTLQVTSGGYQTSNGGCFGLGNNGANTTTATFNLVNGTVDVARSPGGSNNVIGGTANGVFNQSGGTMTYGVTGATNVFTGTAIATATGGDVAIGSATVGASGAYTLAGGTLTVAGTVKGLAATTGAVSNFNFKGGTLAVRAYDATNLGSNSAATASANQTAASNNIGTLENYGGTVAPGGAASAGLMAVTGNYAGNAAGSKLSFDLGGTTAAAAFAGGVGSYDDLTVSGTTALNDVLSVNLIGGFTPASTDTFTILASTSTLSGAFSNVAFGGTIAAGAGTFNVNQVGNSVVLSNYQAVGVPEPTVLGLVGAGVITLAARRRRAVRC